MSREVVTGNRLREGRIASGLSAEQAAYVYGEALKGVPITRKAYLRMEEGYLPKDPKRRLILAGMFGLVPELLLGSGLMKSTVEPLKSSPGTNRKGKPLNITEYRTSLLSYWQHGYSETADDALRDIARRIRALHDKVLYVNFSQKEEMKRLLWGFQLRFAHIAREQRYDKWALEHFDNAVILAREEGYADLEAAALEGRGGFFFDLGNMKAALRDFKTAALIKEAPLPVKGDVLALQGLTLMSRAQENHDKSQAFRLIDEAWQWANQTCEDDLYQCAFSIERYFRLRARALMAAPVKKLRSPGQAADILDNELNKQGCPELKRLHIHHQIGTNMIQAQIWADREYYPIATTTVHNVLELMKQGNSYFHLPAITRIYEDLKASDYGKSPDVARLGAEITKVHYPHLFNS